VVLFYFLEELTSEVKILSLFRTHYLNDLFVYKVLHASYW